ncbi:MAG TPA: dual specificity protein phosphatase family protein [Nitrososphaerales archaeon]|nr:dual specificity protein phosphatase family protein [Nitrososphaerales archaeon]HUK74615.1 dual specificity protein phosphatase family protein [Nitrososphaerales archaeon]
MGRTGRAYRRIRANFTDKPSFFTWVRDGKIAASGRPYSKSQVEWLKAHGITAILTLTEDPLPASWTGGLATNHIPLRDHAALTHSQMRQGADYIASSLSEGKVVLVHCLAGKGRTGSVLASYLMAYEGKKAREAIDELRSMRGGSVEGPQEKNVLDFEGEALREWSTRARSRGTTQRTRP